MPQRTYRKRNYKRRPMNRSRFGRGENIRKLAGTQPETAVQKIARGVGTVATIAKTVSGIVSMINTEDKYVDTTISAAVTTSGTYALSLNDMIQGIDRSQRIGNKIECKSLQFNLQIYMDATDTALSRNIRIMLLYDKKPQISQTATLGQVLTPVTTVGLINKDNAGDRFVILKDFKVSMNAQNNRLTWKKFYIKLDRMHAQFYGAALQNFETGRIFLAAISDSSTLGIVLNGVARFVYHDN